MAPAANHMNNIRIDHIGSLVRPVLLKEVFARYDRGQAPREELAKAQDDAIRDVIQKQEARGFPVVTDGEFRRHSFQESFSECVTGFDVPQNVSLYYEKRDLNETPLERAEQNFEEAGPAIITRRGAVERLKLVRNLPLEEFKHRQRLHHQAEIAAMNDVPEFIRKAHVIYGYEHFINDAGGSVCELDNEQVLRVLDANTLILYIKATREDEHELIRRAESDPKPLYYREAFLDEQLAVYLKENSLPYVAMINPDEFVRWMFPRLFYARIPRYEAIANRYGYTVTTDELSQVTDETGFLRLLETAIARQNH